MAVASPLHMSMERFTEHELTDMLSFFEKNDNTLLAHHVEAPDGLASVPLSSTSLDASSDAAPKHEQSGTSSPVITSTTSNVGVPYCGLLGTSTAQAQPHRFAGLLVAQNGAVLGVVPHQAIAAPEFAVGVQQPAPVQPAAKDSKLSISHSTIEKQRRDRINSLIDELRELVPAAGAVKGPDGADMKRPKHVVLSDTIALLKALKEKTDRDQQQLHELKHFVASSSVNPAAAANAAAAAAVPAPPQAPAAPAAQEPASAAGSAQSLLQRSLSGPAPASGAAAAAGAGAGAGAGPAAPSCPELPQAPKHLPAAVGVLVEEGPGCFLVKVNCKDRHGLLSDITSAIGGLPLQITRAAITTSHAGSVYDVFEIMVEPHAEAEGITALDVQFQVHQALHKFGNSRAGRAAATAAATAAAAAAAAAGGASPVRAASPGTSGSAEGYYDANKRRRSE